MSGPTWKFAKSVLVLFWNLKVAQVFTFKLIFEQVGSFQNTLSDLLQTIFKSSI